MILTNDCIKSGKISEVFKKLRTDKAMSVMGAALETECKASTIYNMEQKRRGDMYLQVFVSLANTYGLDVKLVRKKEPQCQ